MKRTLLLSFVVFLTIFVSACSQEKASDGKEIESGEISKDVEKENEAESIEVDKGLLNVEVTLPNSFFEGENMDSITAQAKEDGIKDVIQNDDGTITYVMSKSKHKEMMDEIKDSILTTVEDYKNNGDFPSIKDVIHNDSFSEFTLVVDQEKYENSFDSFAQLGLGMSGMYYQLFNGVDPQNYVVTIFVKNDATGDLFKTVVYPDALDETE
ncbi:hypothetical protein [Bacillus sp. SM2101]|uniref:hypothetical protein n=1 Tax=Bacillus sp. SM2101 TaxID=2805366 RepID=UPI001BDE5ACF|nr:hypothetical protein [Bacillus sp. SM2101]